MRRIIQISLSCVVIFTCIAAGAYVYNVTVIESTPAPHFGHKSTRFIDVDGESIAYGEIDNKSKKTILFVGGLAAWHGTWWEIMNALNEENAEYNYLALDLPPFGYSVTKKETLYFRGVQAKRIQRFVEEKSDGQKQTYILVAHSYGAGPATEFVLQDKGDVVERLIIIDGVLNLDEKKTIRTNILSRSDIIRTWIVGIGAHSDLLGLWQLKTFTYVHTYLSTDLVRLYTQPFSVTRSTARLSAWVKGYIEDPLVYASTDSAMYETIKIPVRFIWGDKDTLTPITDTDILLEIIPDATLYTLKNIGHIPMVEDTSLFVETLERVLRE
jgi:pimeloyl-ACP methyl ester carboxylesterase